MASAQEPRASKIIRWIVGLVFVGAGAGKLVLPLLLPYLPAGVPSFADVLAQAGVPFPRLAAVSICLLELGGGLTMLAPEAQQATRHAGVPPAPGNRRPLAPPTRILGALAFLGVPRLRALFAIGLAGNMIGALATVSIPAAFGHTVHAGPIELFGEPWRIPLEVSMLAAAIYVGRPWILLRRTASAPS